jgi:hypothetical protein
MAIPTKFDGDAAAIDDIASNILLQVRTMQHARAADVPRMRARLRETLQEYADKVMTVARSE